jgi:hypothetical protein
MSEDVREHARKLAQDLENAGHTEHAEKVHHVLSTHSVEDTFLWALRGVCDTLLTFVEGIDPVSEMSLEGLRTRVDAALGPADEGEKDA